jgi:hypothetical protein
VDQEIGDIDVPAGTDQAVGVGDVALVDGVSGGLEPGGSRAVTDEAADRRAGTRQLVGETTSDEPGGTGDEDARGDPPSVPAPAAAPARVVEPPSGRAQASAASRRRWRRQSTQTTSTRPLRKPGGGGPITYSWRRSPSNQT